MEENKQFFYQKFMNQENYDAIRSRRKKVLFNTMYFSLIAFAISTGVVSNVFGVSFYDHLMPRALLCLYFFFMHLVVAAFITLLILNFKCHVYRNWGSFFLLTLPPILFMVGIFTYSALVTEFVVTEKSFYTSVPFNPFIFFGAVFLYFGFVVFAYYASINMFRREILRQWKTLDPDKI